MPLSEDMLEDLNNLITTAENQCTNLAQDYIHRGWNEGRDFDNTFLLEEKVKLHSENLAALMVTYPSTHGVFESSIILRIKSLQNIEQLNKHK